MNRSELTIYLRKHLPDSIEVHTERTSDGQYVSLCTEYRDGVLHRQFLEDGWQRRSDAFIYALGMLRYLTNDRQVEHDHN